MHLDTNKLKKLLKTSNLTLQQALDSAKISKTAYYALVRKDNLLPKSLQALSDFLGVTPRALLVLPGRAEKRIQKIYRQVDTILARYPHADRQNVLHTLLLLQEKPIDRLRRSLQRGQNLHFHR